MSKKAQRKYFSEHKPVLELPDLIEVQKDSYEWFLKEGLRELFDEVSPINDFIGRDLELHFLNYYLDEPKFSEEFSREKNITYEAPLRVIAQLLNQKTKESKEQEIYIGDFPLMTERGTFIINGNERVVVSQLIRSAGVFFTSNIVRGRKTYGAKIIPNRGAWIEFETDANGVIWAKIDRKRKVAATALLRAFGYSEDDQIKELFTEVDNHPDLSYIEATLEKDVSSNEDEGLKEVYKRIRPGDLATVENAKSLIHSMFFNFDRYDFGRVGRYKVNKRFDFKLENIPENRTLRPEDVLAVVREIIDLNNGRREADDIDHLGNRRVRAIGELVQNKFRVGLARMERIVKDRMSTYDIATLSPNKLINARPVMGVVKEFFMSSQLSQFMDQTNHLSELEHKRRLSALGPGGLAKDRAGFEVRDVHQTHYGRICPIATPEGPNIGLIGHLASYSRLNEYGFLETPFKKVIRELPVDGDLEGHIIREDVLDAKGKAVAKAGDTIDKKLAAKIAKSGAEMVLIKPKVTSDVIYLDAFTEEKHVSTPETTPIGEDGYFVNDKADVRYHGQPGFASVNEIDLVDVASNQILSIATSLIPFVEHDDANRALMGTNMQRQAVCCIKPDSPVVGTGVEKDAATYSGHMIMAPEDGEVVEADAAKVVFKNKKGEVKEYKTRKFNRSNSSTCLNHRVVANKGQVVKKGDVLADSASTDNGELALGQNITVAFMSWDGGNYEDAILLSERVVQKDLYTSIHIEDYSIDVRDTKLGPELVTSDIPNIGEEKLKDLDAEGVVRIGAKVSSGDILVGKITPKGETELSPEEKLLRVIFGEKAKDVRDTSMYLEHGESGKVVDIKVFSRDAGDKLSAGVIKTIQVSIAQLRKIQVGDKMAGRHGNKGVVSRIVSVEDMPFLPDGTPVDIILSPLGVISRMNLGQLLETHLGIAAKKLGYKAATPPLNGIPESVIRDELEKAGYPRDGKMTLIDGRTGEQFHNPVTVGCVYMLKLVHMVEDKMHQRSIGPYSLITQQPLGGKAQFGGQRFGEMEVWALEAYGAAHTLQEILTIKSDDILGRAKTYESIIKGDPIKKLNVPESFNVLVRELKGLCLDVELLDEEGARIEDVTSELQAEERTGKAKSKKLSDDE